MFAGLPRPLCNKPLPEITARRVVPDLLYRDLGVAVEFEGTQHQEDRIQYTKDLDRYGLMRSAGLDYVQVTNEKLQRPQRLVREVHAALVARGYDGPAPVFGERWRSLFISLRTAVGERDWPPRAG